MKELEITLLICIHNATNYKSLKKSIDSIFLQNYIPSEIYIIQNGPTSKACSEYIESLNKNKNIYLIYLKKNIGLAKALNKGIKISKTKFISRLDPGDEIINERFLLQYDAFQKNKNISVCGSFAEEIFNKKKRILKKPVSNLNINKTLKFSNPFIHSSITFKKKDIEKIGSYPIINKCQDYFLWIKCYEAKFKFMNIEKPLIKKDLDLNLMKRRNLNYFFFEYFIYKYMLNKKIINTLNFIYLTTSRFILRILPSYIKIELYKLR